MSPMRTSLWLAMCLLMPVAANAARGLEPLLVEDVDVELRADERLSHDDLLHFPVTMLRNAACAVTGTGTW